MGPKRQEGVGTHIDMLNSEMLVASLVSLAECRSSPFSLSLTIVYSSIPTTIMNVIT